MSKGSKAKRLTLAEILAECVEDDGLEPETQLRAALERERVQNLDQRRKDENGDSD